MAAVPQSRAFRNPTVNPTGIAASRQSLRPRLLPALTSIKPRHGQPTQKHKSSNANLKMAMRAFTLLGEAAILRGFEVAEMAQRIGIAQPDCLAVNANSHVLDFLQRARQRFRGHPQMVGNHAFSEFQCETHVSGALFDMLMQQIAADALHRRLDRDHLDLIDCLMEMARCQLQHVLRQPAVFQHQIFHEFAGDLRQPAAADRLDRHRRSAAHEDGGPHTALWMAEQAQRHLVVILVPAERAQLPLDDDIEIIRLVALLDHALPVAILANAHCGDQALLRGALQPGKDR